MSTIPNYNRIKEVLREQGRSNRWLSTKIDRNESTVSRWCSNVQQPDVETLFKIARVLGVSARELLAEGPLEEEGGDYHGVP